MTFSRSLDLCTEHYDPTYGGGCSCGSLAVVTCQTCGALVDGAATEIHAAWHESAPRPEITITEEPVPPW